MIECTCRYCGGSFSAPRPRGFCTPSHRTAQWAADNPERVAARYAAKYTARSLGVALNCVHCGEPFMGKRVDAKYCSRSCGSAAVRQKNGDRIRERGRKWAAENPDSGRRWKAANRELVRATARASYARRREANPSGFKARFVADAAVRRAREAMVVCIPFTRDQLEARYAVFGHRCWICQSGAHELHMDHVKPISKGGAHMLSNIRPACKSCNSGKKDHWVSPREAHRLVA